MMPATQDPLRLARRQLLLDWLEHHGSLLLADDLYSRLKPKGMARRQVDLAARDLHNARLATIEANGSGIMLHLGPPEPDEEGRAQ